ncbi:MAG: MqnA/MqnD/SBP family protein [Planctomycetota bacterium]
MSETLRVSSVPYLVGRPLDHGLSREEGITLEKHVPARLVELLRAGKLDVALVSSIELFCMPGYSYIPGLCVGGKGAVSSVQVFLRRPIEQVDSIAMDPASHLPGPGPGSARRPQGGPAVLLPHPRPGPARIAVQRSCRSATAPCALHSGASQ